MIRALFLLLTLVVTGCERNPDAPTAEENRQLDEAANLLNEAPANLESIDDAGLGAANDLEEASPDEPAKAGPAR